jgi:SAM-dependent methyltransferase
LKDRFALAATTPLLEVMRPSSLFRKDWVDRGRGAVPRVEGVPVFPDVTPAAFGLGLARPYERALRDPSRTLHLHEYGGEHSVGGLPAPVRLDVDRYRSAADEVDARTVREVHGPLLDVGCGPGRLVKAAILAGRLALGIDISAEAVRIAQNQGLPVLCRSVFQDLPGEGTWGAALLIDGNIGIGGDPTSLLARCSELLRPGGRVLVETHDDPHHDHVFEGVLVDDLARSSLPFPWAEVGAVSLRRYANDAGLTAVREWEHAGRIFAEYARA